LLGFVGTYIGMSRNQRKREHIQIPALPSPSCAIWQIWQVTNHLWVSKVRGWNLKISRASMNTTHPETFKPSSPMNENSFGIHFYPSSNCFFASCWHYYVFELGASQRETFFVLVSRLFSSWQGAPRSPTFPSQVTLGLWIKKYLVNKHLFSKYSHN
jgi:hypothetical protein